MRAGIDTGVPEFRADLWSLATSAGLALAGLFVLTTPGYSPFVYAVWFVSVIVNAFTLRLRVRIVLMRADTDLFMKDIHRRLDAICLAMTPAAGRA